MHLNPIQQDIDKVRLTRKRLTYFFNHMVEVYGGESVVEELMRERLYWLPEMKDYLLKIGIYKASSYSEIRMLNPNYTDELMQDFGLLVNDQYHMEGRFILAIRDIRGDVVALVGWDRKGGHKKYITTPTLGFSRDTSFFNYDNAFIEAHMYRQGKVIVVEGIFDSVALSAVGFPAMATMGLGLSTFKEIMLSRFSHVITLTDNDRGGKSAIPYLYTAEKGLHPLALRSMETTVWRPKTKTTYGKLPVGVKDPDEFVRDYEVNEELEKLYNMDLYAKL